MTINHQNGLIQAKPVDVAEGRVVITPGGEQPYKVEFRLGHRLVSEHPVPTIRDGEALIRHELTKLQFTAHAERADPEAPKREPNTPA